MHGRVGDSTKAAIIYEGATDVVNVGFSTLGFLVNNCRVNGIRGDRRPVSQRRSFTRRITVPPLSSAVPRIRPFRGCDTRTGMGLRGLGGPTSRRMWMTYRVRDVQNSWVWAIYVSNTNRYEGGRLYLTPQFHRWARWPPWWSSGTTQCWKFVQTNLYLYGLFRSCNQLVRSCRTPPAAPRHSVTFQIASCPQFLAPISLFRRTLQNGDNFRGDAPDAHESWPLTCTITPGS